ncbi:tetratricopeptide repeat protein [Lysobacter sp. CFH 32150]|uniref:tetratricopeptide repeat protein n=1 Tax=Lysobacter sp. CFH 32150 TaxID=2927128 RepID=UPI001FA75E2B|nr:tetratricopeptide repeat protein [Lysobacter sp. CFH 32150]MCI4568004.1 tetratricopeptide repeat protein [Lysobacter sp. CFH 32150]
MKTPRSNFRPLTLAVVAVMLGAFAAPVFAQQQTGTESLRAQRAKRLKELGKDTEEKQAKAVEEAPLYPNAARQSPEAKAKGKGLKALQDLQALYEKQDNAAVVAKAEAIGADADAGAYEKAFAYQLAGNASADLGDEAKSAEYFQKALDANGLDNNSHYTVMYNLAVVKLGQEKHAEALATLDRFLAETKSDKPEHQGLRAGLLGNMGRNDEAAKLYQELLAKNPNDKRLLLNAVASYQQADQFDKGNALLADAYKRGLLTEGKELRALYVGYMNAEQMKEALAVINDGVAKGILTPSPELAKDYMVLAQHAYYKGSDSEAIELYRKAAPMAADGEAYLNLAKILRDQGKAAEAKAAAQQALDKGVKKPAEAKQIVGK